MATRGSDRRPLLLGSAAIALPSSRGRRSLPRVATGHSSAPFIIETDTVYDVIVADLPDPRDVNLSRLYTRSFYTDVSRRLAAGGILVTQATSPFFAREAFWSIAATLASVTSPYRRDQELSVTAYHAYVPTFGDWGFVAASPRALEPRPPRMALHATRLALAHPHSGQAMEWSRPWPDDLRGWLNEIAS